MLQQKGVDRSVPMVEIFTIGHSNRTLDELLSTLRAHSVTHLLDVRSAPRSAMFPHFCRDVIAAAVAEKDPSLGELRYEWWKCLGGREGPGGRWDASEAVAKALRCLVARAIGGGPAVRFCLMCSEGCWKECHRQHLSTMLLEANPFIFERDELGSAAKIQQLPNGDFIPALQALAGETHAPTGPPCVARVRVVHILRDNVSLEEHLRESALIFVPTSVKAAAAESTGATDDASKYTQKKKKNRLQ